MTTKLKIPLDVVVFPLSRDQWVFYNVFTRTSIASTHELFALLERLSQEPFSEIEHEFHTATFPVWETEHFSSYQGLLANPSRLVQARADSPRLNLDFSSLIGTLKKKFLLIEEESAYRARFGPKRTILDKEHFGNFHQQLSYELVIRRREDPAKWWLDQKFEPGFGSLNNNLYRAVQEYNLRRYLPERFSKDMSALDIGCGIGYYTEIISEAGASVVGVDPNKGYIDLARKRSKGRVSYYTMNPGVTGGLNAIPDGSMDRVFMSDALLFYFVPESPEQQGNIDILLQDVRRILKADGTFICVDPNYLFWLAPWLGEERYPFTIFSEYTHKTFGVTPSLSTYVQAFGRNGFALIDMQEFQPDPGFEAVDRRAYFFAREYPLWQVYEWKKMEESGR